MKNKIFFLAACFLTIFFAFNLTAEEFSVNSSMKGVPPEDLAQAQAEEINALYGTYWQAGKKNSCTAVKADGITVYSTFMSFNYSNIVWNKTSDSEWICTAYRRNNSSYKKGSEKVILTFSAGDDGSTVLSQYITAMGGRKSGPLKKEHDVEACGNYFVYDKSDSSSPKLRLPKSL